MQKPVEQLKTDIPVLMIYNLDLVTWMDEDRQSVLELVDNFKIAIEEIGHPVTPVQITDANMPVILAKYDRDKFVVFNWCEDIPGIPRSFGKAAQIIEDLGFTFTGSTPDVLTLTDDKRQVKKLLDAHHVSTPYWKVYDSDQIGDWDRFPAIVKPPYEHCSIGISPDAVVTSQDSLRKRVAYLIKEFNQPAIVEDNIDGREFQVGVWGNLEVEVLPPVEADFSALVDSRDHLCTVDSKDDPTSYRYRLFNIIVPAILNDSEMKKISTISRNAYKTIGTRDYARLDIRYDNGVFYVLDVNTNPYIGPECGFIRAVELAGYSYGEFGSRLVNFAWQRKNKIG